MAKYKIAAGYKGKDGSIHSINLSLISFEEDSIYYVYSPALDLTGYGNSEDEAKKSFEVNLEEFIKYTDNKGTLIKEFQKLGWNVKIKGKNIKSIKAPTYKEMLKHNEEFNKIVNEKTYKQTFQSVEI